MAWVVVYFGSSDKAYGRFPPPGSVFKKRVRHTSGPLINS